jgi:urea transport system substrate-binding protein
LIPVAPSAMQRSTSSIVASSNSVHLWAQAVREAETVDVRPVRNAIRHQSLAAPEGIIAIDPETQHTWRPVFIGRVRSDGQFDIVWSSRTAVRPVPFPISRSRPEWEAFVSDLQRSWGGQWGKPVGSTAGGARP